jgi:uncharacterized phage protein (TIGR01671 family)
MSREIKFRVWIPFRKQMLFSSDAVITLDGKLMGLTRPSQFTGKHRLVEIDEFVELKDIKIQQFTGLKDSHNKEIYEGDIIETCIADDDKNERFSVVFVDGCFCRHDYNCSFVNPLLIDNLGIGQADKVIGNIFENPELLNNE